MAPVLREDDGAGGGQATRSARSGEGPAPGGTTASFSVELIGITKVFPGVRALDRVDLLVRGGEVHCLLGENGAGKSTLMNVLAGVCAPEEGVIRVDGREVSITCPRDAVDLGVGMVHQDSSLVPSFTVVENLMLGRGEGLRLGVKEAEEGLASLSSQLGLEVDPRSTVEQLALGQQQQIEIIKALWRGSRVLILDEPTSMLTPKGIEDLERVLVQLRRQGLAIVFITHKLHEVFAIGDRVSVLRRGRSAGAIGPEQMKAASRAGLQRQVLELMFPGEPEDLAQVAGFRDGLKTGGLARAATVGAALLELEDVTVEGRRGEVGIVEAFSLTVHAGEVLGVAGVDGNGQRPLAEAVAGQRPLAGGDLRLAGESLRRLTVGERQRRGLRYVTDDRLGEGVVSSLSVALNLVSKRIGAAPFWSHGRTRPAAIATFAETLVAEYGIMTPSIHTPAGSLSGGNIQKVMVARELSFDPRVVVFNKPTHGLDVKTAAFVRARIRGLVDGGSAGALVISTDIEELLALSDRILVLSRGRLMGVVSNGSGAEQEIGALMVGGSHGG